MITILRYNSLESLLSPENTVFFGFRLVANCTFSFSYLRIKLDHKACHYYNGSYDVDIIWFWNDLPTWWCKSSVWHATSLVRTSVICKIFIISCKTLSPTLDSLVGHTQIKCRPFGLPVTVYVGVTWSEKSYCFRSSRTSSGTPYNTFDSPSTIPGNFGNKSVWVIFCFSVLYRVRSSLKSLTNILVYLSLCVNNFSFVSLFLSFCRFVKITFFGLTSSRYVRMLRSFSGLQEETILSRTVASMTRSGVRIPFLHPRATR